MEMLICQSCGAIIRGSVRGCNTCGATISRYSPTALPVITHGSQPLTINVNPDPLVLERVVARRQMTAILERGGNGNGHGNGNGGNGNGGYGSSYGSASYAPPAPEPTELSFGAPMTPGVPVPQPAPTPNEPAPSPSMPWLSGEQSPSINLVSQPIPPAPTPETVFGGFPVPQPATPAAPAAMPDPAPAQMYGGQPMVVPGAQPQDQPTQDASGHHSDVAAAMQMFAGAAGVGAGIAAVSAALMGAANAQAGAAAAPPTPDTPPPPPSPPAPLSPKDVEQGSSFAAPAPVPTEAAPGQPDFFAGAPQTAPQGAPQAAVPTPPPVPQAPASASDPSQSGSFDFFGTVAKSNPPAPAVDSQPAAKGSEYELSDREDFFAQPKAPSQSGAPAPSDGPPVSSNDPVNTGLPPGSFSDSVASAAPPVAAAAPAAPPAAAPDPASLDFFASSTPSAPKARDDAGEQSRAKENFFPDDFAESKKSPDKEDDDEVDEGKPKITKPLGFQPSGKAKDSKEKSSSKSSDDDESEDDDEEEGSGKKAMAVPPRRKFSDRSTIERKPEKAKGKSKDPEAEDDDSNGNFLTRPISFAGLTMTAQNMIMTVAILGFVGIVSVFMVFNAIGNASGMLGQASSLFGSQQPQVTLAGRWKIISTFQGRPVSGWLDVFQKDDSIYGTGIDALLNGRQGPFDFAGKFSPPDHIQFTKQYRLYDPNTNRTTPDKPIIFSGKLQQVDNITSARGVWITDRPVGQFLHHRVQRFQGEWQAQWISEPVIADSTGGSTNVKTGAPLQAPDSPEKIQKFFTITAICLLGLGVVILVLSVKIFGPGGAMNVWEKQKYIPGQFKPQHNKMVSELAKPLKPGGLPLGRRMEWAPWKFWEPKTLCLPPEVRNTDPHMLVLGAGAKGKSRLIASMLTHDIESNQRAVVLIDSDGGLVELITRWIAAHPKGKEIAKRVTVLDPTYKGNTLGYNPLEMPEDGDLQSAASSLVYGFKAIYTEPPGAQSQWNAQTANILRNSALLLMANGKTLTDLPTLLNDNDFRDVLLEAVEKKKGERAEYITLLDTWGQYKRLARTDQWINWVEPILNRVTPMLGDSRIRSILTKPVGDIKLAKLIEGKKVLLVKVAKGQLDENANLLGSLLVTGVKQAALSLADNPKQQPIALYLDEFDKFIEKETMDSIANETDKFKIAFIGAIKTLQHLPEDFRNQLVINVGTMCCFALAKKDGDMLGPQMFRVDGRKIKHQTLQNFFNKVNTAPSFELISDEEKLNIDRVVGQEARTFFCYRVGTVAGVFHMKSHDFNDVPDNQAKQKLIDKMRGVQVTDKKATAAAE